MHTPEWDRELLRETLREIMSAAGLSQPDVGTLAGRDRSMASRWLKGDHRPAYEAASRFATAVAQQYPELAPLAAQFMAAAGYPEGTPTTPGDQGDDVGVTVMRLRAVARAAGRTVGELLVEHGVEEDELSIPDSLPKDPIIAEIEAEDLPEETKQRLIAIYLERRAEIFEEERLRVEKTRRRPGR